MSESVVNKNGGSTTYIACGADRDNKGEQDGTEDKDEVLWVCTACNTAFTNENSKVMQCEQCDLYYCTKCIGMNGHQYNAAKRDDLLWACPVCITGVRSLI
jgi:hypothetical protein